MENLLPVIEKWASIRKYKDKVIPDDVLKRILEATRRAPSWANTQPWHFIVVRDKAKKEGLKELAIGQKFLEQADTVVICCGDFSAWQRDKRRKEIIPLWEILGRKTDESAINNYLDNPVINPALRGEKILLARQYEQLSFAISYMILQAKHENIGSCIIGGFYNNATGGNLELYKEISKELNLPEHLLILTMVTLGYPSENPKPRPRKSFENIVSYEYYGSGNK